MNSLNKVIHLGYKMVTYMASGRKSSPIPPNFNGHRSWHKIDRGISNFIKIFRKIRPVDFPEDYTVERLADKF